MHDERCKYLAEVMEILHFLPLGIVVLGLGLYPTLLAGVLGEAV